MIRSVLDQLYIFLHILLGYWHKKYEYFYYMNIASFICKLAVFQAGLGSPSRRLAEYKDIVLPVYGFPLQRQGVLTFMMGIPIPGKVLSNI